MKGIADTGLIVAFARANDEHHAWAIDVAKSSLTEPVLTCEAVLAEAAFQLGSSPDVLSLVITVDETDFRAYRRNKRETIPLLCPPRAR